MSDSSSVVEIDEFQIAEQIAEERADLAEIRAI